MCQLFQSCRLCFNMNGTRFIVWRPTSLGRVRHLPPSALMPVVKGSVWQSVHNRGKIELTSSDDFTFSERRSQLPGLPVPVLFFRRTGRRGREVSTKPDRER